MKKQLQSLRAASEFKRPPSKTFHKAREKSEAAFEYFAFDYNEMGENEVINIPSMSKGSLMHKPSFGKASNEKGWSTSRVSSEKEVEAVHSARNGSAGRKNAVKAGHNGRISCKGMRRMASYAKESTKLSLVDTLTSKKEMDKSTVKNICQNDNVVLSVIENVKSNESRLNKYMKYMNRKTKIFEEFFVIGTDAQAIDAEGKISMEPKVLYQYPDLERNKNW